jgi:nicotinate phosphoribosyltransferase
MNLEEFKYDILDTDLYKLTMQQAVFHQYSNTEVEYKFICRTDNVDFSEIYSNIEKAIDEFCTKTK